MRGSDHGRYRAFATPQIDVRFLHEDAMGSKMPLPFHDQQRLLAFSPPVAVRSNPARIRGRKASNLETSVVQ